MLPKIINGSDGNCNGDDSVKKRVVDCSPEEVEEGELDSSVEVTFTALNSSGNKSNMEEALKNKAEDVVIGVEVTVDVVDAAAGDTASATIVAAEIKDALLTGDGSDSDSGSIILGESTDAS
jgi:hypothetical protein